VSRLALSCVRASGVYCIRCNCKLVPRRRIIGAFGPLPLIGKRYNCQNAQILSPWVGPNFLYLVRPLAFSCVLRGCLIVNAFRHCHYPENHADAARRLENRHYRTTIGFKRCKVHKFFEKSVSRIYQNAVHHRNELWNNYSSQARALPASVPCQTETRTLACSTPIKVRAPVSCCVLLLILQEASGAVAPIRSAVSLLCAPVSCCVLMCDRNYTILFRFLRSSPRWLSSRPPR
jgi:hypothetical protein